MKLFLSASKRHSGHTLPLSTFTVFYSYLPHISLPQASVSPNYQPALYPHTIKMLSAIWTLFANTHYFWEPMADPAGKPKEGCLFCLFHGRYKWLWRSAIICALDGSWRNISVTKGWYPKAEWCGMREDIDHAEPPGCLWPLVFSGRPWKAMVLSKKMIPHPFPLAQSSLASCVERSDETWISAYADVKFLLEMELLCLMG